LKSKLQKLEGSSFIEIKRNIINIINIVPEKTYYNIFKGSYIRGEEYHKKSRKYTHKIYKENIHIRYTKINVF
jgi:hypothetical protein